MSTPTVGPLDVKMYQDQLEQVKATVQAQAERIKKQEEMLASQQRESKLNDRRSRVRQFYQAGYLMLNPEAPSTPEKPSRFEMEVQYQAGLTAEQILYREQEIVNDWKCDTTGSLGNPAAIPYVHVEGTNQPTANPDAPSEALCEKATQYMAQHGTYDFDEALAAVTGGKK